jgi:two-component system phosphate regulon sensor histidine kinase PhoR
VKPRTKNRQRLGYRRIAQLLVYLVIVPTVLLLALGIVLMFLGEVFNLLFGILTVAFVSVLVTGIVLILVFLRREANLSELQADFVSKVSHELRTPLTAIRLLVETLARARGSADVEEKCLSALGEETDRLTGRIERLLDWGRMEAGRKQFELREESPKDLVGDAAAAFASARRGGHGEVSFSSDAEADLPKVLVDRHAIVDALTNLLSNAAKYGGSPPVVKLTARNTEQGVSLEVSDNGNGIPRGEHRRIFEKFYRIDDRLSRTREGSGLGLAIVKHIVRAHRGRVVVESKSGAGSTFRIVLRPYVPKKADAAARLPEQPQDQPHDQPVEIKP